MIVLGRAAAVDYGVRPGGSPEFRPSVERPCDRKLLRCNKIGGCLSVHGSTVGLSEVPQRTMPGTLGGFE